MSPHMHRSKDEIDGEGYVVEPLTRANRGGGRRRIGYGVNEPQYKPTQEEINIMAAKKGGETTLKEALKEESQGGRKGKKGTPAPAPSTVSGSNVPVGAPKGESNPLKDAVRGALKGQIQNQIAKALQEIDMAALVKESIEEAFNGD